MGDSVKTPPYVYKDKDRQGRVRYIFRRKGVNRTLPPPNTQDFWDKYNALMGGNEKPKEPARESFTWLVGKYLDHLSAMVRQKQASPLTLKQRKSQLTRLAKRFDPDGQNPAFSLEPRHVRVMLAEYAGKPSERNNMLKSMRAMYKWAVESGLAIENPAASVEKLKIQSDGHTTWKMSQVRQFIHHFPLGTQQYLAIMLVIFTGARRSDLVRIGPADMSNGRISFEPAKKGASPVSIPIHPQLQEAIDQIQIPNSKAFIATQYGKPRTTAGMGNWFASAVREAGLEGLSLHGLRKSQGALLAEMGATQHEIMSIQGHSSAKTSEIYTQKANRNTLSDNAISKISAFRV